MTVWFKAKYSICGTMRQIFGECGSREKEQQQSIYLAEKRRHCV